MTFSSFYPQTGIRPPASLYPQQNQLPLLQQPRQSNTLIGLHGLDSAKQYPVSPGDTVPTFDMDSDHAFIIDADANGARSIKILQYKVVSEEEYRKAVEEEAPIQLTRSEYNELIRRVKIVEEELENAKQPVRPSNTGGSTTTKSSTSKSSNRSSVAVDDSVL